MNCCAVPSGIEGASGVTAIAVSAAGLTVSVAEALTAPTLTLMVVPPTPRVVARPALAVELLMVATDALVELQCPVRVTSCVVPSV